MKQRRANDGLFVSEIGPRALRIFLAVVNAGSMSAGATVLGISQAAVSQQIAKIERGLGQPMFERTAAGLALTQAGIQLRYHAIKILDTAREAELAMSRYSAVLLPEIRCGLMETLGDAIGPGMLEVLQPLVGDIEIASSPNYQFGIDLIEGRFDIVVTSEQGMVSGARWFELATEPGVLIVPKGFFPGAPDIDLLASRLPMARLVSQRKLAMLIEKYLRSVVMGVERRFLFDRAAMTIDFVSRGSGWAISTPFSLLQSHVQPGLIDVYPLPGPGFTRSIVLGARGSHLLSIPELIVTRCRSDLRRSVETRIARIAPRALPGIRIAGSP